MEERYTTVYCDDEEIRIYPMSLLLDKNEEFSDEEVDDFIEGSSLYVSISVGAFLFAQGKEFNDNNARYAYEVMSGDRNWFKNVTWTKEQRVEYESKVAKLMIRFLDMDKDEAFHETGIWSGFGSAPSLDDNSEENFKAYMKLSESAQEKFNED
jgi:hypothetical protein